MFREGRNFNAHQALRIAHMQRFQDDIQRYVNREVRSLYNLALREVHYRDMCDASDLYEVMRVPIYLWNKPGHREIEKLAYCYYPMRGKIPFSIMMDGRIGVSNISKSVLWQTPTEYVYDVQCFDRMDQYGIYHDPGSYYGPSVVIGYFNRLRDQLRRFKRNRIEENSTISDYDSEVDIPAYLFELDNDDEIEIPEGFFEP